MGENPFSSADTGEIRLSKVGTGVGDLLLDPHVYHRAEQLNSDRPLNWFSPISSPRSIPVIWSEKMVSSEGKSLNSDLFSADFLGFPPAG